MPSMRYGSRDRSGQCVPPAHLRGPLVKAHDPPRTYKRFTPLRMRRNQRGLLPVQEIVCSAAWLRRRCRILGGFVLIITCRSQNKKKPRMVCCRPSGRLCACNSILPRRRVGPKPLSIPPVWGISLASGARSIRHARGDFRIVPRMDYGVRSQDRSRTRPLGGVPVPLVKTSSRSVS